MYDRGLRRILGDVREFSRVAWPRWEMREYQAEVASRIAQSVLGGEGRQFAVAFARQSGRTRCWRNLRFT